MPFLSFILSFSISESFLTVKGAALFLPRGNSPTPNSTPHISQRWNKHTGKVLFVSWAQQLAHLSGLLFILCDFEPPEMNLLKYLKYCFKWTSHYCFIANSWCQLFRNRADKRSRIQSSQVKQLHGGTFTSRTFRFPHCSLGWFIALSPEWTELKSVLCTVV